MAPKSSGSKVAGVKDHAGGIGGGERVFFFQSLQVVILSVSKQFTHKMQRQIRPGLSCPAIIPSGASFSIESSIRRRRDDIRRALSGPISSPSSPRACGVTGPWVILARIFISTVSSWHRSPDARCLSAPLRVVQTALPCGKGVLRLSRFLTSTVRGFVPSATRPRGPDPLFRTNMRVCFGVRDPRFDRRDTIGLPLVLRIFGKLA